MIRVEGTKGARTILGEGKSRPQAQARAMAEWRRVYGERPKGVTFTVVSGGKPSKASGTTPRSAPAQANKRRKARGAKADKPAKSAVKAPVGDLAYHSRLVVGTSAAGTIADFGVADSLDGARALIRSKAVKGAVQVILTVEAVFGDTGRQTAGRTRLDIRQLAYLDRVVIGTKANGELLDVQHIKGSLDQARAVAQSMNAGRAIVTTVHQAFQG